MESVMPAVQHHKTVRSRTVDINGHNSRQETKHKYRLRGVKIGRVIQLYNTVFVSAPSIKLENKNHNNGL